MVCELLQQLVPYRSVGPDNIHPRERLLSITVEKLLSLGDMPEDWKKANVTPNYKKRVLRKTIQQDSRDGDLPGWEASL